MTERSGLVTRGGAFATSGSTSSSPHSLFSASILLYLSLPGASSVSYNIFFWLTVSLLCPVQHRLGHSLIPDPFFRIYVDTIQKAKHASDSGVFDNEGCFVPSRFEDLFGKYARTFPEELTLDELWMLTQSNRVAYDPFGWFSALFEWGTTFLLIQQDGRVNKEDVRKVFDGSLFWDIRRARRTEKGWNKGWGIGGDGFFGSQKLLPFSL